MKKENSKIKLYGVIVGLVMLALQHGIYLLSNEIAKFVGITPFSPKIFIDNCIPIVPVFIVPYVWSYAHWAITPMVVSKCDKKYFIDFIVNYIFVCIVGSIVLIFAPTYMDRVAEGLTDTSRTGFFAALMRFWYTLDGGNMAYNLLPSFHCINTTVCFLGVVKRKEISTAFKIYSAITAVLIYLSTVFVKQHFVLDVVSGIAIAVVFYYVGTKLSLGKFFYKIFDKKKAE